jgi:hypothetical protein
MITTLLIQLYPPLKGFSFDQDPRVHVSLSRNTAFQGVLKPLAFEGKFARKLPAK